MIDFLAQYPFIKWTLIGFGVLALLSKFLKFDPIDMLIDRKKKYKYEEINHLGDKRLLNLIELLKGNKYEDLNHKLSQLTGSLRSFAFRALGQYGKLENIDNWIQQDSTNDLALITKAHFLVFHGWKIRGRGSIDQVSPKNLTQFKSYLQEAKNLLLSIPKNSQFRVNVNALLLKIYKAVDIDRNTIHQTYLEVIRENENHAELNFNYFSAISPKWGGSQEELDSYMNSLDKKNDFIYNLIIAQYYFDYVHMSGGNDQDLKIKGFLEEMKNFSIDEDELYKYEFYLLLNWLSNNLEYEDLENYYESLKKPYWKD